MTDPVSPSAVPAMPVVAPPETGSPDAPAGPEDAAAPESGAGNPSSTGAAMGGQMVKGMTDQMGQMNQQAMGDLTKSANASTSINKDSEERLRSR